MWIGGQGGQGGRIGAWTWTGRLFDIMFCFWRHLIYFRAWWGRWMDIWGGGGDTMEMEGHNKGLGGMEDWGGRFFEIPHHFMRILRI